MVLKEIVDIVATKAKEDLSGVNISNINLYQLALVVVLSIVSIMVVGSYEFSQGVKSMFPAVEAQKQIVEIYKGLYLESKKQVVTTSLEGDLAKLR